MRDTYVFLGLILLFAAVNIGLVANGTLAADWTGFGIIVASGMTLALYSFLYKDNPLFKFAEHVFVGVAAAYVFGQTWYPTLYGELIAEWTDPGRRGDELVAVGSDGARAVDVDALFAALRVAQPLCFCILCRTCGWLDDSPLYFFLYFGPNRTYITTTNLELGGAQLARSSSWGSSGCWFISFFPSSTPARRATSPKWGYGF